jgi:hypothetical protein
LLVAEAAGAAGEHGAAGDALRQAARFDSELALAPLVLQQAGVGRHAALARLVRDAAVRAAEPPPAARLGLVRLYAINLYNRHHI